MGRANDRVLNDLVIHASTAGSVTWAEVSDPDIYLLRSYVAANLRLHETVYLQVQQGLLDTDALETLAWTYFVDSTLLIRMWPHVRPLVTPGFAAYLESAQSELVGPQVRGVNTNRHR